MFTLLPPLCFSKLPSLLRIRKRAENYIVAVVEARLEELLAAAVVRVRRLVLQLTCSYDVATLVIHDGVLTITAESTHYEGPAQQNS